MNSCSAYLYFDHLLCVCLCVRAALPYLMLTHYSSYLYFDHLLCVCACLFVSSISDALRKDDLLQCLPIFPTRLMDPNAPQNLNHHW